MTEPPRPPGEGNPSDPTAPFNPHGTPQPTSGGGYHPPTSGGGYHPPTSGAGYDPGAPPPYTPPPGQGYPPQGGGYPPQGGGYPPPAGGYPPPPGGQYGAGPGYGGPGYGGAPGNDDRTWILVAHFGGAAAAFFLLSGWIPPLVAFLARGNTSPAVRAESVKALNFHILWSIVAVIGGVLSCIGIGVIFIAAAWLISTIIGVIAGVKANNGEPYNYPRSYPIIK